MGVLQNAGAAELRFSGLQGEGLCHVVGVQLR